MSKSRRSKRKKFLCTCFMCKPPFKPHIKSFGSSEFSLENINNLEVLDNSEELEIEEVKKTRAGNRPSFKK